MTALCLGFGFVGGVFSPALMIGVLAGTLYGLGVAHLLPLETSGVLPYAICGMMAVTSPVIGAPLSTILIVFELTHNYDLAIAATVAVVFSNLVANHAFGRSYFDVQLRERGFNLREGRDRAVLGRRLVSGHVSADYVALGPEQPVQTLLARLSASKHSEAFLTDGEGRYRGVVRLHDAVNLPGDTRLRDLVTPGVVVFNERTTLLEAMERMRGFLGGSVPLVAEDGRLLGVVPEGAVIGAYLDEIRSLRREENAGA
jgi:CIC family chloride channel protein